MSSTLRNRIYTRRSSSFLGISDNEGKEKAQNEPATSPSNGRSTATSTSSNLDPDPAPLIAPCGEISSTSRFHKTLISYLELPEWYEGNEYILSGYRAPSHSVAQCVRSLFYLHNETVNIYTHLLPALAYFIFLVSGRVVARLHAKYDDVTTSDELVFTFFLFTAVVCRAFSACYHMFANHSERMDVFWLRMDFVGIVLLTVGDFVSGTYMVFWCEFWERVLHWGITISLGLLDVVVLLDSRFQGRRWRRFRVLCFVGMGLSGFAPLAHGIYMFGLGDMMKQSGMPYYLIEGGMLAVGALVYSARFPESLRPGLFDIYGSSHQIFHLLVVLATIMHLVGLFDAYDYNYHHRSCPVRYLH